MAGGDRQEPGSTEGALISEPSARRPFADSSGEDPGYVPAKHDSQENGKTEASDEGKHKQTADLFDLVKDKPCRVTEIEAHGCRRTKPAVIARELQRVRGAGTLQEIQDELADVMTALEELDLFSSVKAELLEGAEVRAPHTLKNE